MNCDPFLDGCIARTPPQGACRRAADACELIVAASVEVLAPFFCPGSRCETIRGVVTHGPPAVETYSKVAAWVEEIRPLHNRGNVFLPSPMEASIGTQLWIDTFPVGEVDGNLYHPPDPDLVHEASMLAAVIGESWQAGLAEMLRQNATVCSGWKMEAVQPMGPQGGFVGWETGFTVGLG